MAFMCSLLRMTNGDEVYFRLLAYTVERTELNHLEAKSFYSTCSNSPSTARSSILLSSFYFGLELLALSST